MKILISGGHLTPALSFIDFVQKNHQDEVVFVGRKYSQTDLQQKSVEREEVTKRKVKFISFDSGKLILTDPMNLLHQLFKVFTSFFTALRIFSKEKPDLFLSFGGYLAVPLAVAARVKGVPIVTHEQTAAPGSANKFIAKFANRVATSFPETAAQFPVKKVVLTGNPIRQTIWTAKVVKPEWAEKPSQRPLLYITGGSQGSRAINSVIQKMLPQLLEEWDIIHQCGKANTLVNYVKELSESKAALPEELQSRYTIREQWITEEELAWVYSQAWAMISRAGANTVQEVLRAQIPTIFVPLAHTHHDEQVKNAQSLALKSAAIVLLQNDLDESHLAACLNDLKKNHTSLKSHLKELSAQMPWNADALLYGVVKDVAQVK